MVTLLSLRRSALTTQEPLKPQSLIPQPKPPLYGASGLLGTLAQLIVEKELSLGQENVPKKASVKVIHFKRNNVSARMATVKPQPGVSGHHGLHVQLLVEQELSRAQELVPKTVSVKVIQLRRNNVPEQIAQLVPGVNGLLGMPAQLVVVKAFNPGQENVLLNINVKENLLKDRHAPDQMVTVHKVAK